MRLQSKPHEIEAFRFEERKTKPPQWFRDAYHTGKVMVTMNNKDQYILIFTKSGAHKAHMGDWVCRNSEGTLFVLSNTEVEKDFEILGE